MILKDISPNLGERLAHVVMRSPSFAGRGAKRFGNESNEAYLLNSPMFTQPTTSSGEAIGDIDFTYYKPFGRSVSASPDRGAIGDIDFTYYKQEAEVTRDEDWLSSFYGEERRFYYGTTIAVSGTTTTVSGSVVLSASGVQVYQSSGADYIKWFRMPQAPGGILNLNHAPFILVWYSQFHRQTDEVTDFCEQNGISHHLWQSQLLIRECFSSIQHLSLRLEEDPEIEDEWVVIDLFLKSDIDTVLGEYDTYVEKWVTQVPWPDRDKIRLSYHIA